MRLLLVSDIHSNLEALEAVLWAAPQYDRVVNLGDVVGYGGNPNEVVERVRELEPISVRGNHDVCCSGLEEPVGFNSTAARAVRWTRRVLSEESQSWLRGLPRGPVTERQYKGVQFVHGSPLDENDYLHSGTTAMEVLTQTRAAVTFFGHTHVPAAYARARRGLETPRPEPMGTADGMQISRLKLEARTHYLINPGSVGQPRDHDRRAAFAIYDSTTAEVFFYRVPYDVLGAQERILAAGLPPSLALRLVEGR